MRNWLRRWLGIDTIQERQAKALAWIDAEYALARWQLSETNRDASHYVWHSGVLFACAMIGDQLGEDTPPDIQQLIYAAAGRTHPQDRAREIAILQGIGNDGKE